MIGRRGAFTLLEILVATAVMLLILGIVFRIIQGTTETWKNTTGKTEGFRGARTAFEAMTRALSQATLNPYFDYVDASGSYRDATNMSTFTPMKYARRSDLHFVCGANLLGSSPVTRPITQAVFFQAPLGYTRVPDYQGMETLLNSVGFYVCYGPDPSQPAFLNGANLPAKHRFRLMQFLQASEELNLGDPAITNNSANWHNTNWFVPALGSNPAPVSQIAENVVALVIQPKLSQADIDSGATDISTDYGYDSRDRNSPATVHQLPPIVRIVMVVIDEASAAKLGNSSAPPDLGLGSLFTDPEKISEDLATLGRNLSGVPGNAAGNNIPLRYEIFQTEVAIRGAKWSTQ